MKTHDKKNANNMYNPNLGFIGNSRVDVSNYLFSRARNRQAYDHAKAVAQRILNQDVSKHFKESKNLTKFLKLRDLTFSKKTSTGDYKTFTVPCTTTIVPLQKSLFNEVELASQKLMISLRKVLQDIYGSKTLEDSAFINSLPQGVREIFLDSIKTSSQYYPQLHHPNMKDYPFFDNVGLDLVLVEDYLKKSDEFPTLIEKNKVDEIPGLPFRILELNAGSPSGASNNLNLLQGIYNQNPEILDSLGKLMPNDHFKVLGETYKSLGEDWTNREDGVQVLLPPGGQNGAAPEIHQLAAFSGLIYADANQLYQDNKGFIRLRTVSKNNPIVTAIYSRVNTDAALFDPKRGLILRDADSGEALYLRDCLKTMRDEEGEIILDKDGKPMPLTSSYAIPGIINAIINKKIYMGGLNRVLDNKIILATLTHYAPKFYNKEIERLGLSTTGPKIMPPQTLPPTMQSVETIKSNPDDWVVKSPSLAGGQGVYILKTISAKKKKEVLEMIEKNPENFAYQQLVKIGRIPVAVNRKDEGYRFANLAADIRMWVFFGGGKNALPKITHNALVRYAPQERGSMSSIVNTSAGGGYAPFVIVDDIGSKESVKAKDLVVEKTPAVLQSEIPVFAGAQMVQIMRMINFIQNKIQSDDAYVLNVLNIAHEIKKQSKEVLSFLHPRAIENIYKVIDILENRVSKKEVALYVEEIENLRVQITKFLKANESSQAINGLKDEIDNLRVLNFETMTSVYSEGERAQDLYLVSEIESNFGKKIKGQALADFNVLIENLMITIEKEHVNVKINKTTLKTIDSYLRNYCSTAQSRLEASPLTREFSTLFNYDDNNLNELQYETLYLGKKDADKEIKVASQLEINTNELLVDTKFVDQKIKKIRTAWLQTLEEAKKLSKSERSNFIETKRKAHFKKFPELKEMQDIINTGKNDIKSLMKLMPALPYAKFNIESFAQEKGMKIEDLFTNKLTKERISILSDKEIEKNKLGAREYAGECFAKKNTSHGLYSDSNIYIWLRESLDPFTMIYTIGHELIHYQQLKNSMNAEKKALKDGQLSMAKFLNYYGNYFSANDRSLESMDFQPDSSRENLYGYSERIEEGYNLEFLRDLRSTLESGDENWNQVISSYGSNLGYVFNTKASIKVKSLQEVLPAFENTKNILFAKELGLEIYIDEVKAALPTATMAQVENSREMIIESAQSAEINWETLRVIASHQHYGVYFSRQDLEENNLTLKGDPEMIFVGQAYNQTQQ